MCGFSNAGVASTHQYESRQIRRAARVAIFGWRSVVMSIVFNINDQIFGVTIPDSGHRPEFGLLRHTLMKIPR